LFLVLAAHTRQCWVHSSCPTRACNGSSACGVQRLTRRVVRGKLAHGTRARGQSGERVLVGGSGVPGVGPPGAAGKIRRLPPLRRPGLRLAATAARRRWRGWRRCIWPGCCASARRTACRPTGRPVEVEHERPGAVANLRSARPIHSPADRHATAQAGETAGNAQPQQQGAQYAAQVEPRHPRQRCAAPTAQAQHRKRQRL